MMTASCYIELRKSAARGTESVIADAMRHLHTRQHLGRTVIVHEQPLSILSPARKQWLKLTRSLQKQRSSTLNADKILKYTHAITRMQRMRFSAKTPLDQPDGDVYFLRPAELDTLPVHCWNMYVLCPVELETAQLALTQLPGEALIIDYLKSPLWEKLGLRPKKLLETRVAKQWRAVEHFLRGHHIDVEQLVVDNARNVDAMDDALDTLLGGQTYKFLQVASEFQRTLELARPLRLTKSLRATYDSLILLAHRVQALTPGAFVHQFLEVYDENDTFFLYDPAKIRKHVTGGESLSEAFHRHSAAGRHHLARSLQFLAERRP
jgi:hypothetical protein